MTKSIERKLLRTGGMEMEFFSFGSGVRPLVILPGVSVKSVMDAADAVAEAYRLFAERYTVYLFDRRRDIAPGFSVYDMAEDTAAAMGSLGMRDADVFGASLGGMIAQSLAVAHPELTHALVLGSTMARTNPTAESVAGGWIRLAEAGDIPALNRAMAERMCPARFRSAYEEMLTALHSGVTEAELTRFVRQTKAGVGFDVYDRLNEIRCPVLVLGAKNDRVSTAAASEEIAEKLGCEIYLYEGDYSHGVYDEAPDFRERMAAFFLRAEAAVRPAGHLANMGL